MASQLLGATFPQPCSHAHPNIVPGLHCHQTMSEPTGPKLWVFQLSMFHSSSPDIHPLSTRELLVTVLMILGDKRRRRDSCRISYCLANDLSAATASCCRSEGPTKLTGFIRQQISWKSEVRTEYPPRCKQARTLKHLVVSQIQQDEFRDFP